MGTKRIDQFPAGTTPLAGSELVPIWQAGATKQVAASALQVAGAPGAVWRSGAGAPSNALGINGDFYLDNVTGNVYAKSGGAYSIVANIVGPSGPTGPTGPPGSNTLQIVKITADYNVLVADDVILVDATAGTVSVFLPDTALALPKLYTVKRIDTAFGFNVIVNSAGGIIDNGLGNLPVAITNGTYGPPSIGCAFGFIPDGLAWWIVSMY